jgi:hypothetical protein
MRKIIAVVAVVVVVLVGCSATGGDETVTADTTESEESRRTEPDVTEPETPEPGDTTTTSATTTTAETTTTTSPTTIVPEGAEGTIDAPLAIGERAEIGENWEVTVTGTNLDATELIADLDEFATPPENGTYAIVSLDVTYVGDEEGDPGFDLLVTLQGGNGRQYDDTGCYAETPNPKYDAPTLTNGGTTEIDMCLDYELEAADGGTLFIEDFLAFDQARVYWSLT